MNHHDTEPIRIEQTVQAPTTVTLRELVRPRATYRDLAREAKQSMSMIQKVATGQRRPNKAIRDAVEKLFQVPASLVFGPEGPE